MIRKRRRLPKEFEQQLTSASLDELKKVFDRCAFDARGGYAKGTALGFAECPDGLVEWLTGQGLDVDTADDYGRTPLWVRARHWSGRVAGQIPLLVSLGADVEARDNDGMTPLQAAVGWHRVDAARVLISLGASTAVLDKAGNTLLMRTLVSTRNADIVQTVGIVKILLAHGEEITGRMREEVERIGRDFEFHRLAFDPGSVDATDAALGELYQLFAVEPVARRKMHSGPAPIVVSDGPWQRQHEELWDLLVPSSSVARTVQGEVIRITGKVNDEMHRNGGANWDREYRAMVDAFADYVTQGLPLSAELLAEVRGIVNDVRSGEGEQRALYRLSELAVAWVVENPTPIVLGDVGYRR